MRAQKAENELKIVERSSDASSADIITSLRTELRSQEAAISEAKKVQGRIK